MFREAVLHFLGVGQAQEGRKKKAQGNKEKYCEACKAAGKANCETCTKDIKIAKSLSH